MNCKSWMAVIAFVDVPLAAQQPGKPDSMRRPMRGPGQMGQMMGEPMMQQMGPAMMKMMLYTPQHLLARKDALGLTADQVGKLTALRDATKTVHEAGMADARAHMKEMEQAANALGQAHWAMLASAAQARAVLTDAQRAKVQVWADSMQAWMQQHRQMMQPGHPS